MHPLLGRRVLRTYLEEPGEPAGYMWVEQEVARALASPADFLDVVPGTPDAARKSGGRAGTPSMTNDRLRGGRRWLPLGPMAGQRAHLAKRFASML